MTHTWQTIAPINYRDPQNLLKVPIRLADGVILDKLPTWLRTDHFTKELSGPGRLHFARCRYVLRVPYNANDLGSPDPQWRGSEPRSIQDAGHELINLANLAIWLAQPCDFGFDVVFHVQKLGNHRSLRKFQGVRDLEAHMKYERTYLTPSDLRLARRLHHALNLIPRTSSLWVAAYSLWYALLEGVWTTRFPLLWFGLESLFGPKNGREVTYRIAHRLSRFLSNKREDRLFHFRRCKELYEWRSKVVHGTVLAKLKGDESVGLMLDTEMYLRRAISKILLSKSILKEFISDRDGYLDSLTFR